jgi:hypothetical protein
LPATCNASAHQRLAFFLYEIDSDQRLIPIGFSAFHSEVGKSER